MKNIFVIILILLAVALGGAYADYIINSKFVPVSVLSVDNKKFTTYIKGIGYSESSNDNVNIKVKMPIKYDGKLFITQKTEISIDDFDNTIMGEINHLDIEDGSIIATVKAKDIFPGLIYKIRFITNINPKFITIPKNAIFDKEYIYINKCGIAVKKKVKIGQQYDNDVEIILGLNENDQLIKDPSKIKEGDKLENIE